MLDAHCNRAKDHGARITQEPMTHRHGERQYKRQANPMPGLTVQADPLVARNPPNPSSVAQLTDRIQAAGQPIRWTCPRLPSPCRSRPAMRTLR